jgi:hypothetical protein
MNGKFLIASELKPVNLDWGVQHWFSDPNTTGAEELVVVSVEIKPGFGHNFLKHPITLLKDRSKHWQFWGLALARKDMNLSM